MGDFKKNPDKPFEVRCPNKIRKRIAMHERAEVSCQREIKSGLAKILSPALMGTTLSHGSMWSRFTDRVKRFLK